MRRSTLLAVLLLVGCVDSSVPERATLVENRADPQMVSGADAMQVFQQSLVLEYRPGAMKQKLDTAVETFMAACSAGDPQSCWMGISIRLREVRPEHRRLATSMLDRHCRGGHELSCRALQVVDPSGSGLNDDWTDVKGCERGGPCDASRLESECERGWPASCMISNLRDRTRDLGLQRWYYTAIEGCKAGLILECWAMVRGAFERRQLCAIERVCRGGTAELGDLHERSCELGNMFDCRRVAAEYLARERKQPFRGRARTLMQRACDDKLLDSCEQLAERSAELDQLDRETPAR